MSLLFKFFLMFLLATSASYAQKIEGLGGLKIGMSYDDFHDWTVEEGYISLNDGIDGAERSRVKSKYIRIHDLQAGSGYAYGIYDNYLDGYHAYLVDEYSPSGVDIKKLMLIFRRGKLIYMNPLGDMVSQKIVGAISAKYGDPIKKIKSKGYNCVYLLTGVDFYVKDKLTYYYWRDDSAVKAYHAELFSYGSDCQSRIRFELVVQSSDFDKKKYDSENKKAANKYLETVKSREAKEIRQSTNLDEL
ncbi:hypothetical protein K4H28_00470 [Deefgea tanakiae]|uniref:Uncharacterized protein n=1 Tax=Deefgea tanakiae TaxID=2865840 RepID=A0ABX8Z5U2_9NEIS|nr:hypothetical protein [Deefgea tanakiae]QZA77953.1 hypothetical protein K4H28_00470 [Deefgea tanakiae]